MVIVSAVQEAETPVGKPLAPETPLLKIPVAPVVVCVIEDKTVLLHKVGVEDAIEAVFVVTIIVPVAFTIPQPPVRRIE